MSRYSPTRLPAGMCPACGYAVDAAGAARGGKAKPKPGDWSLCMRCAAVNVFDARLLPVAPPPGALEELRTSDPEHYQEIQRTRLGILVLQQIHPIPDRGGRA
jgi:hypothetical protein